MLDVTRLRVLVAVARHGSVTGAARELRYAQPSVSHHLARLEAETGSRLIQRAGRGIRLTEAGIMLAARAEEILGRLDAAETELAAHTGLRAGRVRLAAFPSALGTFVPVAAAALTAAHPAVELRLTEAEAEDTAALLRSGAVDVALGFRYSYEPPPPDRGLREVPLLTDPTYLITPATAPASEVPASEVLAQHAGSRWISGCERCRTNLVATCATAGFAPDIAFTTDDYVAVQALVAAGLGVTTLPGLALAAHQHPGIRATPLPGHDRIVTAALYAEPPDPPATAALLRHLTEAVGDLGRLRPRSPSRRQRPGASACAQVA